MAEAALKKLQDHLNCPVCLDTYSDPKQLQCHHIYCRECLERLVVRDHGKHILTCPNCRQVTSVPANGVAGLQSAFQTNHLLDILREHKKTKEGALYCAEHQERELELYCESCEQLICLQCTITEHQYHVHNVILVEDIFEKHKQEIKASLSPARVCLSAVSEASERVEAMKKEILDQQATLEANMQKDKQRLIEIITARMDEHISKLRRITEGKVRDLDSQVKQLNAFETQLSSGVEMVEETLTTGSPAKIVSMKSAIASQVKKLTTSVQKEQLSLEPVTQANMEYLICTEVIEACQNYGAVGALSSPDLSMCQATGEGLEVATVGESSSVVLKIVNFKGQPLEEPIQSLECELVSDITGSRTRGSVERRGQDEYEINYEPAIKGKHQLHIKVECQHIYGSPFSTVVTSPVEKLGDPVLTIRWVVTPNGITTNQRGEVVVTEKDAHCVSTFSLSGERLRSFGTYGSSLGHFNHPAGVAVDGDGSILVVDSNNNRVQKFSADGQLLTTASTLGGSRLQFSAHSGIAVNKSNNMVYVVDSDNARVQVLNSDMTLSGSFGKKGSGRGHFDQPLSVAFDSSENVYITDCNNHRIQVFTAEGKFLRMFGKHGKKKGELDSPRGVAIDTSDRVYICDGNDRVSVFTSGGQFVTSFGRKGAGEGELSYPTQLAVDRFGVVYVCDFNNRRVQYF